MIEFARPKLLLADDSVTIRKVVEMTFADEGIDVATVGDADAAMQKFVEIQPDIVLVDTSLPGTNGYQICEMIKADELTKNIPVLLLVGSFEPFDQDAAERARADGFLTKPFHSIRDLVERVSDLLGREPKPAATPETADIENLYQKSFAETQEIEEYDTVDDLLGDPGMDDDLIETASAAAAGNGHDVAAVIEPEPIVDEFDWSPEAIVAEPAEVSQPIRIFDDEPQEPSPEPSAELIEMIANRVIEKLSDKAVREIAQEAVPRIAEKLIREALDDDKKG